ncbi:MAG: YceI family protein [Armatimonadetes bacterium]|nr:YceI family protein [Armatimonadota bacterium]
MKISKLALGFMAVAIVGVANAQTKTFKIDSSSAPQQRIATVESNADFETFTGRTSKLSGTIQFDPRSKKGHALIEIDAASLDTGIEMRNEHMRGEMWLNTEEFRKIRFETTKVEHVRGDDYRVTGKFTFHGVTRTIKVDAKVRYIAQSDVTRKAKFKGDVLHFKTDFRIKLSDYGVKIPDPAKGRVSNTVKISISAFAQTG